MKSAIRCMASCLIACLFSVAVMAQDVASSTEVIDDAPSVESPASPEPITDTDANSVATPSDEANDRTRVLVIVGAAGEASYGKEFAEWAASLRQSVDQEEFEATFIGLDEVTREGSEKEQLLKALESAKLNGEGKTPNSAMPLWVFLIGHGTFADGEAKFNLNGPDISAKEMAKSLASVQRTIVLINCSSSSGPFVNQLSGPKRVIVTATQSGEEQDFSRFGRFMVEAITSAEGDLDHDDEVSVLEAFVKAGAEVSAFYREENRIVSEHALIDDNGDGLGTRADAFVGLEVPPTSVAAKGGRPDGEFAWKLTLIPSKQSLRLTPDQRQERDEIESELRAWRNQKADVEEAVYWNKVESLMLRQAKLYAEAKADAPPVSSQ